ncbi:MAG: hypothetical protein EXR07_04965 [Acetobacteraceae bacterium]|nr:hypothetical protein [Acetobacteraceae bacterium]
MDTAEEYNSWIESRRLVIAQLGAMDASIRELTIKVDRLNDLTREKAVEVAREAQTGLADVNLRLVMLETRIKIWGAVVGLLGGGVATILVNLVQRAMVR